MSVHFGPRNKALNLTDIYAIYSLRLVNPDYTGPCIRILNSGDATEYDIGFSDDTAPGFLDYTSLLGTLGANTGTVTIWYDQSGNGNDATAGPVQPTIFAGTVWYRTAGRKNLPMMGFDGGVGELLYASTFSMAQPDQFYFLGENTSAGVHFLDGNAPRQISGGASGSNRFFYAGNNSVVYGTITSSVELHFCHFEDGGSLASLNQGALASGSPLSPGTASIGGLYIGAYRTSYNGIIGGFQEILCYTSDAPIMNKNRASILQNQHDYFKPY